MGAVGPALGTILAAAALLAGGALVAAGVSALAADAPSDGVSRAAMTQEQEGDAAEAFACPGWSDEAWSELDTDAMRAAMDAAHGPGAWDAMHGDGAFDSMHGDGAFDSMHGDGAFDSMHGGGVGGQM